MPGPIIFQIKAEGQEEPTAVVAPLSAYEAQIQLQALEAQAVTMEKMLVITAVLRDWPEQEPEPEEEKPDDKKRDAK